MVTKRDLSLGLLVILLWAFNTVTIKFITLEVEPFTGLALRFLTAVALFAPFLRRLEKDKFILIVQISLLLTTLHWGSLIWGIDRLEASTSAILLQTQAIFSVLIGWVLFKEKIGPKTALGIGISILGVIAIVGIPKETPDMLGVSSILFSMFTVALAYSRQTLLKDISPTNFIAHIHVIGLLPALAFAFIFETPLETNWSEINYYILALAILFQASVVSFSHMLWARLMSRNTMSILPNLTLLLPFFSVFFAVILLNESLTMSIVIGGLLTTLGVGVIILRKHKPIEL